MTASLQVGGADVVPAWPPGVEVRGEDLEGALGRRGDGDLAADGRDGGVGHDGRFLSSLVRIGGQLDRVLEALQRPGPHVVEVGAQQLEAGRVEPVDPPGADGLVGDEVGRLQGPEVLGHRGPADGQALGQLADRQRAVGELLHDGATGLVAEELEGGSRLRVVAHRIRRQIGKSSLTVSRHERFAAVKAAAPTASRRPP